MHFKHPEILYFLFLLIVPVLVHLFQLRRFQKEYFTNIRFLKELSIQTRKSSVIKKWLLLITRLLLLACLILAFAQPFFDAADTKNKGNEMVILLDNSFSMQAKGDRGELLKRAVQDLLENTPESQQFSLLTTTGTYWDTDIKAIQKDLQQLNYSPVRFRPDFLLNKIKAKKKAGTDIVIITDGVNLPAKSLDGLDKDKPVYFILPEAENKSNIAIDSVYISQNLDNFYEIKVNLQAYGEIINDVPVSLYNGKNLIAKAAVTFKGNKQTGTFTIPKKDFHGYASIQDNSLTYDNTYYFSITKPQKANVLAIGESAKNNFLSRIYTNDDFTYTSSELKSLDYSKLEKQDAIILNELTDIPQSLITTLNSFYSKGGNITIIPSAEGNAQSYNLLLRNFGNITLSGYNKSDNLITRIAFSHPLYRTVFEKRTNNFQYPKVNGYYNYSGNLLPVLSFADNSAFLGSVTNRLGNVYVFTAPVNRDNSNFLNSPLVVPTFYNMGQNSSKTGINAITIGSNEAVYTDAVLGKDEVISVKNESTDFIPMQQALSGRVKLTFGDYPEAAGNYSIYKGNEKLKDISFNHARAESNLSLDNKSLADGYTKTNSISTVFSDITSQRTGSEVWKWFIIGTLILLLTELFIQKFVK